MARELKVIQDFYDFTLWLIRHTEKFPRHHRYSLGLAMENRLHRIRELLLRARSSPSPQGSEDEPGPIQCWQWRGGLLKHYCRQAA